jgi:hypothetical protein
MATGKQISYISFLLKSEMPELFKTFPTHDKQYTDPKINYVNIILEKKLAILTKSYAQILIDFINKGDKKSVEQMIFGLSRTPEETRMAELQQIDDIKNNNADLPLKDYY